MIITHALSPVFAPLVEKASDIVITACWVLSLLPFWLITVVKCPFLFGVINVMAISQERKRETC